MTDLAPSTPRSLFPSTRHSVVRGAASADPAVRERALEQLARAYWGPLRAVIRARWGVGDADADDLAQGFFVELLERGLVSRYDPSRGRFRTYLRTCLNGYVSNELTSARRLKRGGGARFVSIDRACEMVTDEHTLDTLFHREWVRSVMSMTVDALRERCAREGKSAHFELFARYDLADDADRPTYATLAVRFGLPVTQVTNHLAAMRRRFRVTLLDTLRALAGSDDELRADIRELVGGDAP